MRGLTPEERELLHARAVDAPRVIFEPYTREWSIMGRLRGAGRLIASNVPDPGRSIGYRRRNHITDFGRLALRVCPVGEL